MPQLPFSNISDGPLLQLVETIGLPRANDWISTLGDPSYIDDKTNNDDLAISYGKHDSEAINQGAANVTNSGTSLQMSYTMGGATLIIAENSVDNQTYVSTTTFDRDGTTIKLSLAF